MRPLRSPHRHRRAAILAALDAAVQAEGESSIPLDAAALETDFVGYRFRFSDAGTLDVSFRLTPGTPSIVWRDGPGWRGWRFLGPPAQMVVRPLVAALVAACDGDELEMDYTLSADQPIFPHSTFLFPDGWWDAWKDRAVDEGGQVQLGEVYREAVLPAVWEVLAQVAGPVRRVVDLGGGDGEWLAAWLDQRADIGEAVLLDRNAAALDQARTRLGDRARVVAHDVATTSDAALLDVAGGPIDVLLAVGVLCVNVLTRPDALRCADAIAGALAPGGVAVLAGWTPALLRRSEWEARGLRVVNTTRPDSADAWGGPQLYVVQRPA